MNLTPRYFYPYQYGRIENEEVELLNERIVEIVNSRYYQDGGFENEKANEYWDLLSHYYEKLHKKITRINARNFNFLDLKISKKIQKKYLNQLIPNLDQLDSSFSGMMNHLNTLFIEKCKLDSTLGYEYFYDASDDSHVPSIGLIDSKVIVIINRNIDILFNQNVEKFDSIFLHEAAHIYQNDTQYFFKKHFFLSRNFLLKSVYKFFKLILPLLILYSVLYIFLFVDFNSFGEPQVDAMLDEVMSRTIRNQMLSKFSFFAVVTCIGVFLYRLNIRKKNRLLVEYGADVFSLVKSKNTTIIDTLKVLPNNDEDGKNIHLNNNERILDLLSLLSFTHLLLNKNDEK